MKSVRTDGVYHPDEASVEGSVLVFEAGTVRDVGGRVPDDADLVYDGGGYALPGLVDAHSHASVRPWEGDQLGQLKADKAVQAVRAATNLRRDLEAGTTTMRLMGEERFLDIELAELERDGELAAPRLLPSGVHLTPTGGHGRALTATDGEDEIRQRIRENLEAGAHHIKFFSTGGVSSATGGLDRALYSRAEVRAIVEEAHRQGVHVATHAHGGPGAIMAIEEGVDTIEHGAALGREELDALDGSGRHVVGTFSILHHPNGIEAGDAGSSEVMEKVETAREREQTTWQSVLERDIDVALGTDSMHGHLAFEVRHMIDLGASPERAIRAVTTEAARACRVDDRVGRLSPGMSADILIVEEDPREDPETLGSPLVVIKDGEVVA